MPPEAKTVIIELPPLLIAFALTIALSFLIGLGLREYYIAQGHRGYFGSVRTYLFIGMLGFGLFQLPSSDMAYPVGLAGLAGLLAIYYWQKTMQGTPGMIGVLTALLTYLVGPLAATVQPWFLILFVVSILFILNAKERIRTLSERISQSEIVTLATFLTLAGVILPLLPQHAIAPFLPLTPYQIWLAVVVSTGISYMSYVLQVFVFPQKGLLISGLLGGLYSSTASTLMIARRTRDLAGNGNETAAALVAATAMMYFRLIILVAIFNPAVALLLAAPLAALGLLALAFAYAMQRRAASATPVSAIGTVLRRNPLELSAAAVFALLLVVMAIATQFALEHAAVIGVRGVAFVSGFYDIDPFVISLLQSRLPLENTGIAEAIIIATASNNLLKTAYIGIFAQRAAALRSGSVLVMLALAAFGYLATLSVSSAS